MRVIARGAVLAASLFAAAAAATPSGRSWKTPPVSFQVFNHAQINGVSDFQRFVLPAIDRGFGHWNKAKVACTRWEGIRGGGFTSPGDRTAINAQDKLNRVIWLGGAEWTHGDATLGLTSVTYIVATGEIIDGDMELNNNKVWKAGGPTTAVDIESIITHEAGHFLGLDHSPETTAIMYATYTIGDLKTKLTQVDVNDVCTVYPATPGGGKQGSLCKADSDCAPEAPACRGVAGSPDARICTLTCANPSDPCPTGYTCQDASPAGRACLRPPGVPDLCSFCSGGTECLTGRCVKDGRRNWCTTTCRTAVDCGPGYECVSSGDVMVCAPTGQPRQCPSPQCTSAADCAPGYACTNGMCEATGNLGERCEISDYCSPCSVCVGTSNEAYCRACCGGQGAGGVCNTCTGTPASCASGQSCATLASVDKACVPVVGATSCQLCDANTPCQQGLQCIGGRCHAPCNPAHPGNCSACYATGTGVGYCACPDEIAQEGQLCAPPPGGFLSCLNGHACVGEPKTCRALCSLSDPYSCPTGKRCAQVDGRAVCVPIAPDPAVRCNNIQGTSCTPSSCAAGLVCYAGRCYEPCNPEVPACSGCVVISGLEAVCACDDQRVGIGQKCGATQTGVAACVEGSACTAQVDGTCRAVCDPASPKCGANESCQRMNGDYVCVAGVDGGSDGETDGGTPDGGTQTTPPRGCGCGSADLSTGWPLLALAFAFLLRRRPRTG